MTTARDPEWEELRALLAEAQRALAEADQHRDLYVRSCRSVPPFIVKRRTQLTALLHEMGMVADDPTASDYELRRSIAILRNTLSYGVPSPRAPHPLAVSKSQVHHV